jgi:hypothetical protein
MIGIIIMMLSLWALAAVCNAVMDVLAFKFKTSVFKNMNPNYWNPAKSWRNKYKQKMPFKGPAFIGSTTFLSFLTDAWHLFQFLSNTFLALSVLVVFLHYTTISWWAGLAIFLGMKLTWGVFFELFYGRIFRKKK